MNFVTRVTYFTDFFKGLAVRITKPFKCDSILKFDLLVPDKAVLYNSSSYNVANLRYRSNSKYKHYCCTIQNHSSKTLFIIHNLCV